MPDTSDELPFDLSALHKPVTGLFQSQIHSSPDEFRLTAAQLDGFESRGYISKIRVLSEVQVDALREELERLVLPSHPKASLWHEFHSNESPDPSQVLFHALGAWRMEPGFHDLLFNPAVLIPAHQLLGGKVRFWHDQLFCKPAKHGGVVAWHQDYSYWTRTQPMAHLTVWIGLDDATVDNGCLQYVPGSHKWDLLPITGLAGNMEAIRETLSEEQWDAIQNPVPIELKKGEAAIHHPLLVHGSFENRTEGPRRGVVLNLVRDGVENNSNEPLLDGVPPLPLGEPLGGQFFPLLYSG